MIRVILVDETAGLKHVDFFVVPVAQRKDFTCSPNDAMAFCSIVRLSRKLGAWRTSGYMGKYFWYRLADGKAD